MVPWWLVDVGVGEGVGGWGPFKVGGRMYDGDWLWCGVLVAGQHEGRTREDWDGQRGSRSPARSFAALIIVPCRAMERVPCSVGRAVVGWSTGALERRRAGHAGLDGGRGRVGAGNEESQLPSACCLLPAA